MRQQNTRWHTVSRGTLRDQPGLRECCHQSRGSEEQSASIAAGLTRNEKNGCRLPTHSRGPRRPQRRPGRERGRVYCRLLSVWTGTLRCLGKRRKGQDVLDGTRIKGPSLSFFDETFEKHRQYI